VFLDVAGAGLGQRDRAPTVRLLGLDQALVGELLQRRVDRAGAGPPRALRALADLLDDLVAVPGLLGEQREDGEPDVAAGAARAPMACRAT